MLLTIIITNERVHAHLKNRKNNTTLSCSEETDNLGHAYENVLKQAQSKGWKTEKPISTAVILPWDLSEWNTKIEAFKKQYKSDLRIVFQDNLAKSYLKGAGKDIENSDYIILGNEGEGSELFFYKAKSESQLIPLNDLNLSIGCEKLRDHVVATLAQEGLVLGDKEEVSLLAQIKNGGRGGNYTVKKENNGVKIEASIAVSSELYDDKTTEKRSVLSKYMHPKILKTSANLKEVILVGDYFNNASLLKYLKQDLELSSKITNQSLISLEDVVNYASKVAFSGCEQFLKAEEAQESRIAELQRKKDAKNARKSLLAEIKSTVVDLNKAEEYKTQFSKKADELGIPREVVMWNIEEALDTLELEKELSSKHAIDVVSSSDIDKVSLSAAAPVTPTPPPSPATPKKIVETRPPAPKKEVPKKEVPKPVAKKVEKSTTNKPDVAKASAPKPATKKIISTKKAETPKPAAKEKARTASDVFKTVMDISRYGFHAQIAEVVGDKGEKVVRYITNEQVKNAEVRKRFEKLHRVETGYYDGVTTIKSDDFGKYYYRTSFDGTPLSEYITKNSSKFRANVEKWSSNDLKFILKIWKEVDALDYNFDIDAGDIIVLTKRSLFSKEIDVKLANFKDREVSKEKMEAKMHAVLSNLIGAEVYKQLRAKFSV